MNGDTLPGEIVPDNDFAVFVERLIDFEQHMAVSPASSEHKVAAVLKSRTCKLKRTTVSVDGGKCDTGISVGFPPCS